MDSGNRWWFDDSRTKSMRNRAAKQRHTIFKLRQELARNERIASIDVAKLEEDLRLGKLHSIEEAFQ